MPAKRRSKPAKRGSPRGAKRKPRKQTRPIPADPEILNADGAAAVLGITKRTLLQMAREGRIPGTKLGREWRFLRSALRRHVAGAADADTLQTLLEQAMGGGTSRKKRR